MALAIQKDVVGLEVAVHDVLLVEHLEGVDYLGCVQFGTLFVEGQLLRDDLGQDAAVYVVYDKIDLFVRLESKAESHNVGALYVFEDLALGCAGYMEERSGNGLKLGEMSHLF